MDIQLFLNQTAQDTLLWCRDTGLELIVIIVLALVALKVRSAAISRLFSALSPGGDDVAGQKHLKTLESVVRYAITATIVVVTTMMVLDALNINIGPVLAGAGIIGLAVGFGAQQLVQDVIGGFFILMHDQIRVGDVVEIAGKAGLVEKVNLRMTVLRDTAGSVHYVRNGAINTVTNMTRDFSYAVFEIGVGYGENIKTVIELISEIGLDMQSDQNLAADILEPIEIWGLDKFADSAIIIKARIKTKPIKQWAIGREFNLRLKNTFDANNIEIPFPHMTVFMAGKSGNAVS